MTYETYTMLGLGDYVLIREQDEEQLKDTLKHGPYQVRAKEILRKLKA